MNCFFAASLRAMRSFDDRTTAGFVGAIPREEEMTLAPRFAPDVVFRDPDVVLVVGVCADLVCAAARVWASNVVPSFFV